MRFNIAALSALTLALASPVVAIDGWCNTDKTVLSDSGYRVQYPALRGGGTCVMDRGAEGKGVGALQSTLNHCYDQHLDVDNDYGTLTKNAVKAAQRKIGLTGRDVDGEWGPKTAAKMDATRGWWGWRPIAQGTERFWDCDKV